MRKCIFSALVLSWAAPLTFGHGTEIQFTYNPATGKIESRQIISTTLNNLNLAEPIPPGFDVAPGVAPTAKARIYVIPVLSTSLGDAGATLGAGWYARTTDVRRSDPGNEGKVAYISGVGLAYQYEPTLPGTGWQHTGSTALPNLSGSQFRMSYTTGLQKWNGSGWDDAGATQAQLINSGGTNQITSSDVPSGATYNATVSATFSSNPHSFINLRLLGNGVDSAVDPADGVYVIGAKLASTAVVNDGVNPVTPVGDSDPFYFVLFRNPVSGGTYGQNFDAAIAVANQFADANGIARSQIQAVPEPAAVGSLAVVGLMALARRRRAARM